MSPEAKAYLAQLRSEYNEIAAQVRTMNDELLAKYHRLYMGKRRPRQASFVYFINSLDLDVEWNVKLKVGVSKKPLKRFKGLSTGSAHPLLLRHLTLSHDGYRLERRIHKDLGEFRERGEWFDDKDWVAKRMFGSDAFKGTAPNYEYEGNECVMATSIATHYFHEKIDLLDEHKPDEYLELKRDLAKTYEMIKRVVMQENMFGTLRY
jgi:hypothetical protein